MSATNVPPGPACFPISTHVCHHRRLLSRRLGLLPATTAAAEVKGPLVFSRRSAVGEDEGRRPGEVETSCGCGRCRLLASMASKHSGLAYQLVLNIQLYSRLTQYLFGWPSGWPVGPAFVLVAIGQVVLQCSRQLFGFCRAISTKFIFRALRPAGIDATGLCVRKKAPFWSFMRDLYRCT